MKNERLVMKSLKNFIAKRFDGEIQMFDCRNIVGDPMETVFYEDGVTVDYCYSWNYIEIFGLTDEEFNELNDQFGTDKKWQKRIKETLEKAKEEEKAERDRIRKKINELKEETKNDLIGLYQAGYDRGYEEAKKDTEQFLTNLQKYIRTEKANIETGINNR